MSLPADQLLASQQNNLVTWLHQNPLTGSSGISRIEGWFSPEAEPDPMGVNVGFEDPYINCCISPPEEAQPMPLLLAGSGIPNGRCTLDGMAIDCDQAMHMLDIGAATFETMTTVRVTYTSGRVETFVGRTTLPPGLDIRFTGQLAQAASFGFTLGNIWGGFNTGVYWALGNAAAAQQNAGRENIGRVIGGFASFFAQPQDTVTAPIGDLRGNLEKILKQGRCEEYTNKLLAQAAKMFAGNYPHMKTIMDGYDLINSSKGGGYILKQTPFDTVDGDLFANGARPGAVWLVPNRQYGSMSARRIAEFQADYAWTALHETFHLGKQGGYSDEQMAAAAYSLAGKELPTTSQTGYGRATFFSDKFDKELMKHCPKP